MKLRLCLNYMVAGWFVSALLASTSVVRLSSISFLIVASNIYG